MLPDPLCLSPFSRAVQRSLAIIRQAKQKKKKKEYCMYYNRFGKCNRGESCPYIHDPEKVAVCTRYGWTRQPRAHHSRLGHWLALVLAPVIFLRETTQQWRCKATRTDVLCQAQGLPNTVGL